MSGTNFNDSSTPALTSQPLVLFVGPPGEYTTSYQLNINGDLIFDEADGALHSIGKDYGECSPSMIYIRSNDTDGTTRGLLGWHNQEYFQYTKTGANAQLLKLIHEGQLVFQVFQEHLPATKGGEFDLYTNVIFNNGTSGIDIGYFGDGTLSPPDRILSRKSLEVMELSTSAKTTFAASIVAGTHPIVWDSDLLKLQVWNGSSFDNLN